MSKEETKKSGGKKAKAEQQMKEETQAVAQIAQPKPQQPKKKKALAPPESPFIERMTKIVTTDGRTLTGILTAYDGKGNCILANCQEVRPYKSTVDGEETPKTRPLLSITVPTNLIKEMYQQKWVPENVPEQLFM